MLNHICQKIGADKEVTTGIFFLFYGNLNFYHISSDNLIIFTYIAPIYSYIYKNCCI